jgi:hypothetical protein
VRFVARRKYSVPWQNEQNEWLPLTGSHFHITQIQPAFDAFFRRAAHLAFIISERRFLPAGVSLFRRRGAWTLLLLAKLDPRPVLRLFRSAQRFFIISDRRRLPAGVSPRPLPPARSVLPIEFELAVSSA